jgi:hypothetical protein
LISHEDQNDTLKHDRQRRSGWYRHAIPRAEQLYETYLKERAAEQEPPP